jgi:thioredoxin-like negative regulator of GroEL
MKGAPAADTGAKLSLLPTTAAPASAGGIDEAVRARKRVPIPRYTELVNRLQVAVGNGDTPTVDRLLGDFAAVKGNNHPYLLKLKAYQYLQARDFASAERLLNQVLVQDQMDRDANINMVVVEASTGRIDAARQRAARLAKLFPEDETLAAMGRRLN